MTGAGGGGGGGGDGGEGDAAVPDEESPPSSKQPPSASVINDIISAMVALCILCLIPFVLVCWRRIASIKPFQPLRLHASLVSQFGIEISMDKNCPRHSLRDERVIFMSGSPAVVGKSRRPEALRPCLSTGLPFSVQGCLYQLADTRQRLVCHNPTLIFLIVLTGHLCVVLAGIGGYYERNSMCNPGRCRTWKIGIRGKSA